jgi:hypothetical protein
MSSRRPPRALLIPFALLGGLLSACAANPPQTGTDAGAGGAGAAGTGGGGAGGGGAGGIAAPLVISGASPRARTGSWSVNYWTWPEAYGDPVAGTETQVAALAPRFMRVGGYNNDANVPNPFDQPALDTMIAYARAIDAEPILQVPLLADTDGQPATADTAAAMVTYANVTKGYGIKYFSIGNEPDLYPTMGLPSNSAMPARPGYTAEQYCTDAATFVAAMKAADPTIQIVGPDLAYQYTPGTDWLTPILSVCGDLFDVVAVHRYPFASAQATLPAAAADPARFRAAINSIRGIMQATGQGAKPLAITEMNIAYDATTGTPTAAAPGTVPSGLWLADVVGDALELDLWTAAMWDISDPDQYSLGLIGLPPAHAQRPEYYAYALYAASAGPTLVDVTSAPPGVSAHPTRTAAGDATHVVVINWNQSPTAVAFQVTGLAAAAAPSSPTFDLPALSMAAIEIPDDGSAATASVYGAAQLQATAGPAPLAPR